MIAVQVQIAPTSSSVIDILDRVLDKGIVIDAWVRVSVVGIDVIAMEARVIVASIETCVAQRERPSRPRFEFPARLRE